MRTPLGSVLLAVALSSAPATAAATATTSRLPTSVCGTPDVPPELARQIEQITAGMTSTQEDIGPVQVPVAFHNVYSGKLGKVADGQILALINNLNVGFRGTPFSFYLYRIDRTNNKAWYANCGFLSKNEQKMKRKLARDPRHILNIYTCVPSSAGLPPGQIVLGYAWFPFWASETSYMHGVVLHPSALPGGSNPDYGTYGLVAIHEVGHYLGLYHTFQGGCDGDGDFVTDTPSQSAAHFACPIGIDTCSDSQGQDDTQNFMNYSNDACMNHFTSGQLERMITLTELFKPSLVP